MYGAAGNTSKFIEDLKKIVGVERVKLPALKFIYRDMTIVYRFWLMSESHI